MVNVRLDEIFDPSVLDVTEIRMNNSNLVTRNDFTNRGIHGLGIFTAGMANVEDRASINKAPNL